MGKVQKLDNPNRFIEVSILNIGLRTVNVSASVNNDVRKYITRHNGRAKLPFTYDPQTSTPRRFPSLNDV
jgi:hypothetical protein